MKNKFKIGAALLAVAVLFSSVLIAMASAPLANGTEMLEDTGVIYHRLSVDHDGNQNINAVVFPVNNYNRVMYSINNVHANQQTTINAANALQTYLDQTNSGAQVLAGINADFFSTTGAGADEYGAAFGMMIESGGHIIKSAGHHWGGDPVNGGNVLGFRIGANGERIPVVGIAPTLNMAASTANPAVNNFTITNINTWRNASGFESVVANQIILFNERWGPTTQTAAANSYEVRLEILSGDFTVGGAVSARVVSSAAGGNSAIGEGYIVLSANGTRRAEINGLQNGDVVNMNIALTPSTIAEPAGNLDLLTHSRDFTNLDFAIGGDSIIVLNGEVRTLVNWAGTHFTAFPHSGNWHRTAVGINSNNEMVFVTIDGAGAGGSVGANISTGQLAQILIDEFDIVHAMALDGGGSTQFVGLQEDGEFGLWNSTWNNVQRPVANNLFVVHNPTPYEPGPIVSTEPPVSTAPPTSETPTTSAPDVSTPTTSVAPPVSGEDVGAGASGGGAQPNAGVLLPLTAFITVGIGSATALMAKRRKKS